MPRLEYSERFAEDMASITSAKVEARVYNALDNIETFGDFGSKVVPDSILREFGLGVRKVVVSPFDLIYSHYPDEGLVRVEALIHQRAVK